MQQQLLKNGIQLAIVFLVLIATSLSASAFWPYSGGYCGWYGGGYYSDYSQESAPYFALHPPVYYSYPVARTYGFSPFPYSTETTSYPTVIAEPKLVINQYADQKPLAESSTSERQPLRIINPHVVQQTESNQVKKVSWEKLDSAKPKIVYPTKLSSTK